MNCVGIFDILSFDASQANPLAMMPHYQVLKEISCLDHSELNENN